MRIILMKPTELSSPGNPFHKRGFQILRFGFTVAPIALSLSVAFFLPTSLAAQELGASPSSPFPAQHQSTPSLPPAEAASSPGSTTEMPAASVPPETPPPEQAQNLTPEQKVLSKMHEANQMEMKAGEMAMKKGTTDKMRSYGHRLFVDHRFGEKKVTELASRLGFQLVKVEPQTSEEKQQAQMQMKMMQQLEQAEGPEFDQQFAQAMKKGHEQVIANLRSALEKLKTPEVVALVKHLIPILEQHETLARHLMGTPESK